MQFVVNPETGQITVLETFALSLGGQKVGDVHGLRSCRREFELLP